jgi:hypothetical protein
MLVATTHFLVPGGAGSKMRDCISDGSDEYTGRIINSGAKSPSACIRLYNVSHAVSISSCPVKKRRISPAGSERWICIIVMSAASR